MNQILSWHSIRDFFKGQWVELIDCDWEWSKPFPRKAAVRHHAWDRNELLALIEKSGALTESSIMYLGVIEPVIAPSISRDKPASL